MYVLVFIQYVQKFSEHKCINSFKYNCFSTALNQIKYDFDCTCIVWQHYGNRVASQ